MANGLMRKALTSEGIEKHLADFGLDAEAAGHTSIQSLSGGQKVKVHITCFFSFFYGYSVYDVWH